MSDAMYVILATICGYWTYFGIRRRWERFPKWGLVLTIAPYIAVAMWIAKR